MLLHRCVSMGSGWVGGWTDGRTDGRTHRHAGSAASCALCNHRGCSIPVTVSRCPSPVPIPSLSPALGTALRSIPLCRDARMGSTEPPPARIPPSPAQIPPPPRPGSPPGRYLQALGNGAEQHQVHQPPDPPHAAGTPRPRASVSGGHGRGPRLAPGDRGGGGGAEPRRPYAPPQRSRPGSAQIGSARLGSARRGAVHAAPPQLGGEEDWRGVRGGRGAEDARFGAARFGCAHPSAAPQPRVDPAAFRGCRSRPRAAAALRVTLLFLLRPLPSERESRAAAAAAALRVLHLGNLQRDRGCFVREHWAGPACALRGCGVRERSRVGRGRNKTGSAAGRLRTGLLLKELLTRYRWLLALPTCPFLTLHITHFHLPSAQDDP